MKFCIGRFAGYRAGLCGLLAVLFGLASGVRADDIDRELDFASALAKFGLPYYGSRVIERLLVTVPGARERAKPVLTELLVVSGRLREAEEMAKTLNPADPRTQGIQLILANGFYNAGEFQKTRDLYDAYFKKMGGKPPADTNFFRNAANQYAQILEHAGDPAGAIKAYQYIVDLGPRTDEGRQALCEQAELYLKLAEVTSVESNKLAALNQGAAVCDKVLWGGLDLWFGRALIAKANVLGKMGKVVDARKVLSDQMDVLRQIDTVLKEQGPEAAALSPIAGARAALGDLYKREGDELRKGKGADANALKAYAAALTEYVNVVRKYPKSPAVPEVATHAEDVYSQLQAMGRKLSVDPNIWRGQIKAAVFAPADEFFRSGQYDKAIVAYEKLLKQFPSGEGVPAAMGNLMLSYARNNEHDKAAAVAKDLGARFGKDAHAGMLVLQLAKFYEDQKDDPRMLAGYNLFLQCFPKHDRAGVVLYRLSFLRNQAKDTEGAKKLLQRIVDELPNDPMWPKAMSQLAWSYYASSNYVAAIKGFSTYLETAQPSPDKAQAQFFLATSYRLTDKPREALAAYTELIGWLQKDRSAFARVASDLKKNDDLLEQAVYQIGGCWSAIKEPANEVAGFREKALKSFDEFRQRYPDSKLASKALRSQGAIYLEIGKIKEATQVFDSLAAKYPNTDEGKSALYSLARSAIEVRQLDQAKEALNKMAAHADKFAPDLFIDLGRSFSDAKLPGEAARCFDIALKQIGDSQPRLLEAALFAVGQAKLDAKDFTGAFQALDTLFKKFPTTGFFQDGKFALAVAARQLGQFDAAEAALGDVIRQFSDKPAVFNKASMELGKVQRARGEKDKALASYQRVVLLADPQNADLAPLIEDAYLESFQLGLELKHYDDVMKNTEQYEKTFPHGKYLEEARKARSEARAKASGG